MTPEQLKQWMKKFECNQVQLGKALGLTKPCISRWLSGQRKIPSFLIYALEWIDLQGGAIKQAEENETMKGRGGRGRGRKNT